MAPLLAFLAYAYLVAAVPFGVVVTTIWGGDVDVRSAGSGNIGATNVARVYGWRLAGPVMALDVLKGFVPTLLAGVLWPELGLPLMALTAAVAWVGHCFSIFLEFRGGKGVATGAGALLAIAPLPTLAAAVVWGAMLALTGRSSLAALLATVSLVGLSWVIDPTVLWVAAMMAVGTGFTHITNIRRLVRGEESAVVRPVRWRRQSEAEPDVVQWLAESPAGTTGGEAWRQGTWDDPLAEGDRGEPLETLSAPKAAESSDAEASDAGAPEDPDRKPLHTPEA